VDSTDGAAELDPKNSVKGRTGVITTEEPFQQREREKLGMSEYAQRFAENGIDLSVLPDLTDQDLKEIGVILGHRRKILRAIASLEAERSVGDVLRLSGLHGTLRPHGPRRPPRGHFGVAETVSRFGGVCSEIHG
jgi:hypothetical protein